MQQAVAPDIALVCIVPNGALRARPPRAGWLVGVALLSVLEPKKAPPRFGDVSRRPSAKSSSAGGSARVA